VRAGPHPRALSLARSRSLGPQALLIPRVATVTDMPSPAIRAAVSFGPSEMLELLVVVLLLQQSSPRDARPSRGTGSISGTVTAADTGLPVRRVQVVLMDTGPLMMRSSNGLTTLESATANRTQITDHEGRYAFTGLAAGAYRIRVTPRHRGRYLSWAWGTTSPMDAGKPIQLADGQRFDRADLALPRGAAINGRVVDEFGEPVARARVSAARVRSGGTSFQRAGTGLVQTDDLGRFRIYGLEPGEYVVMAEARAAGQANVPADGEAEGFSTTYYPSALSEREAARIGLKAGGESEDAVIQMVRSRIFRISGSVIDSKGQIIPRLSVLLMRRSLGGMSTVGSGVSNVAGAFTIADVVPGDYRLIVRPRIVVSPPPGFQADTSSAREFADLQLSVTANIDDLVVATRPGISMTGKVVFAEGPPPTPAAGMRVVTTAAESFMMMGGANAQVGANLQFTLENVFGLVFIRPLNIPSGYAIKEILLGSIDITDRPVDLAAHSNEQLQIVLTNRVADLEVVVSGNPTSPPTDSVVLAIPTDRTSWRLGSVRLRTSTTARDGRHSLLALLPGRYYVLAITRDRMPVGQEPPIAYFEQLIEQATAVVLAGGEARTVELRLSRGQ
jgi:protocatechuate 3,4-dioxygenase beta subunit